MLRQIIRPDLAPTVRYGGLFSRVWLLGLICWMSWILARHLGDQPFPWREFAKAVSVPLGFFFYWVGLSFAWSRVWRSFWYGLGVTRLVVGMAIFR